jgi:tetratricopeptide (TPR) repeat protein
MSAAERRLLHGEITTVLEDIFSGDEERIAVQLAYHSQRANMQEKAIRYLRLAGDQTQASYANEDAIRHYTELLKLLPEPTQERFEVLGSRVDVYGILAQRSSQVADAEEMLAIARELKNDLLEIDAQLALFDVYIDGDHILAKEPAEKALELARTLDNPVKEAGALGRLGGSAWLVGDYNTSCEYLEAAVALFREAELPNEAAKGLATLSLTYGGMYEYDKALEAALEAVELSRESGDRRLEATSLRRVAIGQFQLEQHSEALPIVEQALALHREVGDLYDEACAHDVLGIIYFYLGRMEESEAAYLKSLQLGHDLFATTLVQFATCNLANDHYWAQGRYEEAVHLLDQEIHWALTNEDEWLIGALNYTKGWLLAELGLPEAALTTWNVAHSIIKELAPGGHFHTNVLAWMGIQQATLGEVELAKDLLDQASDLGLDQSAPDQRTWPLVSNANLALLTNDEKSNRIALEQLIEVIEPLQRSFEYDVLEEALNSAAQLSLALNDPEGAYEYSRELSRLLDHVPGHPAKQDYAYTHAQVLQALGRAKEAEPYIKRAYDWITLVADKTENEAWRRSWLEDARRNKEILEVAAEMGIA